jgi:ABC-type uncharacterized transport system permease subunit
MFNSITNGAAITSNGTLAAGSSIHGTTLTTGTTIHGSLTLNNNSSSMNQQVKVAVFKVTRNKHNEIKSSAFIQEMWIEKKPGISLEYAVGKALKYQYEADEIVIKEIYNVYL